ncbi:MAG: hypothetical protein M1825_004908 [Sarcosagium campestre]|nr:MAG: hypothetical protein M1825_004908 [Sarcosagium campestre]
MLQDLHEREFQLQCACRVVDDSSHVHHAQRLEGLQAKLRDAIDELWVAFEIAKHCDAVFTTPPLPSSEQEVVGGHIEGAKDELQQAQSGGTSAEFETTKDGHQDINDEKGDGKGKSV